MAQKYFYFIYFNSTDEVFPVDVKLQLSHKVDEDWKGIRHTELTGSFTLAGTDFDKMMATYGRDYYDFWIYKDSNDLNPANLIFVGYLYPGNVINYNERTIQIKDFGYGSVENDIIRIMDNKVKVIGADTLTVPASIENIVSSGARTLITAINTIVIGTNAHTLELPNTANLYVGYRVYVGNSSTQQITVIGFGETSGGYGQLTTVRRYYTVLRTDINSIGAWQYSTATITISSYQITTKAISFAAVINALIYPRTVNANSVINLNNIKMASLRDINGFGSDGSVQEVTLKEVLKFLEITFRMFWYIEPNTGYLNFKTPANFATPAKQITLSSLTTNKKIKTYDKDLMYFSEYIEFHENNRALAGIDWDETICRVEYINQNTKKLVHDLKRFCTRYSEGGEYNNDGIFVAYTGNGTLITSGTGYKSGTTQINSPLCPANIYNIHYRSYIYINKRGFKICEVVANTKPQFTQPIIRLEPIETVLQSPNIAYDSIVYEQNGVQRLISLITEQSTDLNSNITKFESYEFDNTII